MASSKSISSPHQRAGPLVGPACRAVSRLLPAVLIQQAFAQPRRVGQRVATVPVWTHLEVLQHPQDRAVDPRTLRVAGQVEAHELRLEVVGALLSDRSAPV